jgi:hypothetical protein
MDPGALRKLAFKSFDAATRTKEMVHCQVTVVSTWTTSSEDKELFILVSKYIYEGRIMLKTKRCYFIKLR